MVVRTRKYGEVILVGSYGGVVIVLLLMVGGGDGGEMVGLCCRNSSVDGSTV